MTKGFRNWLRRIFPVALVFITSSAYACASLWVQVQGGESNLGSGFKQYVAQAVSIECGGVEDVVIEERSNRPFHRSGSIHLEYDGATLMLQVGLKPYYFHIPPNGIPLEVSLDEGHNFRNGAVLTAVQDLSR